MPDKFQSAPVTCLMTVFNAAPYIEEAVKSLVNQTRPPTEIIVIDDGSTDGSGELASAAGGSLTRVLRFENGGVAAGRNRGIKEITNPYVLFSDADDISTPDRIERSLEVLENNPSCQAVFGRWRNFWIKELAHEECDSKTGVPRGEQVTRSLCTALYRSDFVRAGGPFETEGGSLLSDAMWLAALCKQDADIRNLDHLIYLRRIHHTNISRKKTNDDIFNLVRRIRNRSGPA